MQTNPKFSGKHDVQQRGHLSCISISKVKPYSIWQGNVQSPDNNLMTLEIEQCNEEKLRFRDRYASCWHLKLTVARHNHTEEPPEGGDKCSITKGFI